MIKKLLVLNGTEGHKFIVGNQYANTEDTQIVKEIFPTEQGFTVMFENKAYVEILTNNVMVFYG